MTKHNSIFTEKPNPSSFTQESADFQQGQKISSVPASRNSYITVIQEKSVIWNWYYHQDFWKILKTVFDMGEKKKEKTLYFLGNSKWLKVYNLRMLVPKCKET